MRTKDTVKTTDTEVAVVDTPKIKPKGEAIIREVATPNRTLPLCIQDLQTRT
jgi:hypothetical protein